MSFHVCKSCGQEKDVSQFDKKISDGPREEWNLRRCKQCTHENYLKRYSDKDSRSAQLRASRNWKKENPERHAELAREWRARNRDKVRAVNRLNYAIRKGVIPREPCEVCGANAQAHHDSYEPGNELDVRWLCQKHHKLWHQVLDDLPDHKGLDVRFSKFVDSIRG